MPRGISKTTIKARRREHVNSVLQEVETIIPDGLRGLFAFVKSDLQQGNDKMATARCIAMLNRLDAAPTVQRKLAELLPGLGEVLKNRYARK